MHPGGRQREEVKQIVISSPKRKEGAWSYCSNAIADRGGDGMKDVPEEGVLEALRYQAVQDSTEAFCAAAKDHVAIPRIFITLYVAARKKTSWFVG